jgi:outer membrane receptor for ferrienterochelin and colicins
MTFRVAVALVLAGARLAGQGTGRVYGSVTDTAGRPLDRVRVRAITRAGGTREVAVRYTDATGSYRFDSLPAGWLAIDAGLIGYDMIGDSLVLAAGDSLRVDLRLPMRPIIVSPTIVTAAKRSQLLDQAVTSVALVGEQQIAQRAVNTIDEAVDKAPGVQFIAGQVNVRGSSGFVQGLGSRVLLLVDGVPANQGDRGGINWDIVPVDQIARVEVVKGAGSALYGSSAFGGVVNLITKEVPSGWHARVRVTGGTFANPPHAAWAFRDFSGIQDGLDLESSYARGTVRGGLSAGARHSDGYRQQDRADHWQVSAKGEWRPEPATLVNLSGAWASDQYDVPEPWCVSGQCGDQGQAFQPFLIDTVNRGNRTRSDKGYFTALVTRTPSEQTAWTARASWIRTHFTDDYPQRQPPLSTADFAIANRVGLEGRMVSRPDADRVVTAGLELTRSDVLSNVFSGDTAGGGRTHIEGAYSAYAEAEQSTGRVRTTIGARGDFLAIDGGGITAFVSPRAGAVWPTAAGAWRASLGRAYRAPSLAERFVTTYALGFRVVPNPALRAENGWSAELGRLWTPRPWLRGDAAAFFTLARDLIEPVFDTATVAIQFQNVAKARWVGLDLSITATPVASHLTATLAYQLLDARELAHDTVPERPLLYRPRHLLTLGADYAVHAFGIGGDFRFSGRFERQDPLFPGDPQLPGKVLDLRASWSGERIAAHLKVANVLNYIYNLAPRSLEPVRTATLTVTFSY